MSKLFYDHLIEFEEIEIELTKLKLSPEEHGEIKMMIEETIHYRLITRILDHLPREHHEEFLKRFHEAPYHLGLIDFLKEKVANIEEIINEEIRNLEKMFLEDIKASKIFPKTSPKA